MIDKQEHERNNAAYRRLKDSLAQTYPKGWFVGIAGGEIVGAAATFDELEQHLDRNGHNSQNVFIVEAGVTYPDYVTILL